MAARKRKRSKKGRRTKRRRRGMGSVITVRRAGMGAIFGRGPMLAIPPLLGGGAVALVAAGIRWFVNPQQGNMQRLAVKWAPIWGALAGVGISGAMYAVGGKKKGMEAFATSATAALAVGGALFMQDWLLQQPGKGSNILASLASQSTTAEGTAGLGAIVFQRPVQGGMGTIVAERAQPYLGGMGGPYGEDVSLRGGLGAGVNTSVFGTTVY